MSQKSLALIIGIDYKNTNHQLDGCQYDAHRIKDLLLNKFNFLEENITLLVEDDPNSKNHPTGLNIMNNLGKLIIKAHNNHADHLFIYYSGHGAYIHDKDGDEKDKRDEVIIPLDVGNRGVITDDVLHDYLEYIPEGCRCFGLFDCCHSGTLLDLKYKYSKTYREVHENEETKVKGDVVMISGCQDDQVSIATMHDNQFQGIMTKVFLDTLEEYNYQTTFFHLLDEMRTSLEEKGFEQYPQLTSSRKLNHTDMFSREEPATPMFVSN